MRKLWMILCLAVLVSSAFAQDYKVLDRSEKRRPDWVGRSGDEAIALGAEKATLEGAPGLHAGFAHGDHQFYCHQCLF